MRANASFAGRSLKSANPYATESIDQYLGEISRTSLLTEGEEQSLARRAREGDAEAERELIARNLRFVVSIARRYQHRGLTLEDLIGEGNVGLIAAAHRFDPEQGVRFITYAIWWVRQAILIALMKQVRVVRIPPSRLARYAHISKARQALQHQLGREPSLREIASHAGIALEAVDDWRDHQAVLVPLDASSGEAGSRHLDEHFAADGEDEPPEDTEECASLVSSALLALQPREALVLCDYFGLEGRTGLTLDAIATKMQITRERVRQIRDRALGKLRYGKHAAALFALAR
jgi:RNA polymerase primary sigma factor